MSSEAWQAKEGAMVQKGPIYRDERLIPQTIHFQDGTKAPCLFLWQKMISDRLDSAQNKLIVSGRLSTQNGNNAL